MAYPLVVCSIITCVLSSMYSSANATVTTSTSSTSSTLSTSPTPTYIPDATTSTASNQKRAFVLGPYNMPPWSWASFPDSGAKWIWNKSDASANAPANDYGEFTYLYNNTSDKQINALFYGGCDNNAKLYVNGMEICDMSGWNTQTVCSAILNPGQNIIKITCTNVDGPAGVILTAKSGSTVLFNTNETWTTN